MHVAPNNRMLYLLTMYSPVYTHTHTHTLIWLLCIFHILRLHLNGILYQHFDVRATAATLSMILTKRAYVLVLPGIWSASKIQLGFDSIFLFSLHWLPICQCIERLSWRIFRNSKRVIYLGEYETVHTYPMHAAWFDAFCCRSLQIHSLTHIIHRNFNCKSKQKKLLRMGSLILPTVYVPIWE